MSLPPPHGYVDPTPPNTRRTNSTRIILSTSNLSTSNLSTSNLSTSSLSINSLSTSNLSSRRIPCTLKTRNTRNTHNTHSTRHTRRTRSTRSILSILSIPSTPSIPSIRNILNIPSISSTRLNILSTPNMANIEIEHTMFVLNVDLWSEDALKEVNLVRHTTTTPSISSTTPASYEQVENTPAYSPSVQSDSRSGYGSNMYGHSSMNPYSQYSQVPPQYMHQSNGYGQSSQYGGYHGGDYGMHMPSQAPGYGPPRVFNGPGDMMTQRFIQGNQPQGMFTRNLIGSLAASAFRLQDPADKIGIWFVLQDLSVRTEGNFRLRFSFVNVGPPSASPSGTPGSQFVNTGKAPVLASCFSEVFTVYSAKKFPGVCESTVLSKTFATQGIKIPIRKEGVGKNGRGDDDDDYE
ncbi:MAG: hypothetical protein STHCBS139747_001726 [Sporothrix thermara]